MNKNWGYVKTRAYFPLGPCRRCLAGATVRHHKDRDPTNLDPENIEALCRACHAKEHAGEQRLARRADAPYTGRFKGVCYLPGKRRWLVQIVTDQGRLVLGTHDNEEDAALVHDAAVLYYWGGEGYLNLLPDDTSPT